MADRHIHQWLRKIPVTENVGETTSSVYRTPTRQSGNNYIRLIKLLPGEPGTPISCRFEVVDLGQPGVFTALSYTWGEPTPTNEIQLNGEKFTVRSNLWNFLHEARKSNRSELLWIDAVSINQQDIKERNHQVALMGQIYQKAHKVLIWLGIGTDATDLAMGSLLDMRRSRKQYKEEDPEIVALVELFNKRYWRRVWIQQEVVLARQIELCCGEKTIREFSAVSTVWNRELLPRNLFSTSAMRLFDFRWNWLLRTGRIARADRTNGTSDEEFLLYIIGMSIRLECFDPRDHIYGLLGLFLPKHLALLHLYPDYSMKKTDLNRKLNNYSFHVFNSEGRRQLERFSDLVRRALSAPMPKTNSEPKFGIPEYLWPQAKFGEDV